MQVLNLPMRKLTMNKIHANALLSMSKDDVFELPEGFYMLSFDKDKAIKATKRRLLITWYMWEIPRRYGGLVLNATHYLGNQRWVDGVVLERLSVIFWDTYHAIVATQGTDVNNLVWDMSRTVYEITTDLHNLTLSHLGEYVTTVDLGDIDAILSHPAVVKAKADAESGEITINEAHKRVKALVNSDIRVLRKNGLASMSRAGVLSNNQLVQLIGPRGYVRKTNGDNFKHPIYVGYADGLSTIYDSSTESRSASTAYYMNDRPLQDSEYFNRMMQLFTGVITEVEGEDCGTKGFLYWKVAPNELEGLVGKYHMVDGKPVEIQATDTHLIGELIKIRSITACDNHNTTRPCKICLGGIHRIIPPKSNPGHTVTIFALSSVGQLILSTKHVIASTPALVLELNAIASSWVNYNNRDNSLINLTKRVASGRYLLRVQTDEIFGLNAIQSVDNPDTLSPQWVSGVSQISLSVADRDGNQKGEWVTIETAVAGKKSALSSGVIKAIREHGVTHIGDLIEIPLIDFMGKELLIVPRSNESMVDYLRNIKNFIFGSNKNSDSIMNYDSRSAAIHALKSIFNEKINISFVQAEIYIRAAMTRDYKNNDYRLPRGNEPFSFCPAKNVIANRSISAGLSFQGQEDLLSNPKSYLNKDKRHAFHMDALY